jgi:hypothetical protein
VESKEFNALKNDLIE